MKKIEDGIGEKLSLSIYAISTSVISIGSSFFYGWKLTLVILSITPLMAFAAFIISKVIDLLCNQISTKHLFAGSS